MFPRLLIVIRDPAHAVRLAVKQSLHSEALFNEVWNELLDARHALAPDIVNSDKWQNLLSTIQKDLAKPVARPATPEPLAGVIQNFRFAKQ